MASTIHQRGTRSEGKTVLDPLCLWGSVSVAAGTTLGLLVVEAPGIAIDEMANP